MRFLPLLSLLGATSAAPSLDWPLDAGTRWTYTDDSGQTGLTLVSEGDGRLSVRGPPVLWGGAALVLDERGGDWVSPATASYLGDDPHDPPWMLLDLPLSAGKTWVSGRLEGDPLFTYRATVSGVESIETPSGTYDAWRVAYRLERHLGTERSFDAWFVDGVGLVQLQQVSSSTLGRATPLDPAPTFRLAAVDQIAQVDGSTTPSGLSVTAEARGEGQVGEPLPMGFALENHGPDAMHVIASLDASDVGWRYPKIDIEIEHVGVGPVTIEPMGRCGVVNPLYEKDLRPLGPGESLDPFGPGSFSHHLLRWAPELPGEYRVRMVYDLGDHADWSHADAELRPQLSTVPSGRHTSDWATITVQP